MADNYILGYGSIMEKGSRDGTVTGVVKQLNPDLSGAELAMAVKDALAKIKVYPAKVTGYSRGWYQLNKPDDTPGKTTTFLGAVERGDGSGKGNGVNTIHGVLVGPFSGGKLQAFDTRESGYTRTLIPPESIQSETANVLPQDYVAYIYLTDLPALKFAQQELLGSQWVDVWGPNPIVPLVQSYIDLCVKGCLQAETDHSAPDKSFQKAFFQETDYWKNTADGKVYWINDRPYPRRARYREPDSVKIDKAINEYGGEYVGVGLRASIIPFEPDREGFDVGTPRKNP